MNKIYIHFILEFQPILGEYTPNKYFNSVALVKIFTKELHQDFNLAEFEHRVLLTNVLLLINSQIEERLLSSSEFQACSNLVLLIGDT